VSGRLSALDEVNAALSVTDIRFLIFESLLAGDTFGQILETIGCQTAFPCRAHASLELTYRI